MPREKQVQFPPQQVPPKAFEYGLLVVAIAAGVIAAIWKNFG